MEWFRRILCLIFGGVFVFSGVQKLRDPGLFLEDIRGFDMLPDPLAAWTALTLPWLECLAGLAVVTGFARGGGLLTLNVSLIVFLAAIGYAHYRGLDIRCGCFGSSMQVSSYLELYVRDAVLLLTGVFLLSAWRNPLKNQLPTKLPTH